jgi:glycosyltransferase involved in cell wall biosynthesis
MSLNKIISVVIPVFNEANSIQQLHQEIVKVCSEETYQYEIIIVDDGSTDGTDKILKQLSPLTYIRLRRNFGQTAAIDCGIKQSHGEIIITMDGDGQNDPADIPRMIQYLTENDLDIVSGWRKNRKDPLMKRLSSRAANLLRGIILHDGLHDSGCSLKIYKAECFNGISLYGEIHRFIPALLKVKGFRIGEIVVNHRPRKAGKTKYNWTRGVKGILDMINVWFWHKYAVRPLHLLGGLGGLSFLLGLMVAAIGITFYILNISLFRFFLPQLSAFLLISGIQIFIFGIIADMLAKNYFSASPDTPYSIKEVIKR